MNFDTVNDRQKGDKEKEKGMEGSEIEMKGKKGDMEIRVQWRLATEISQWKFKGLWVASLPTVNVKYSTNGAYIEYDIGPTQF